MCKDDVDVVVALLNTSTVKQAATTLGVTDRRCATAARRSFVNSGNWPMWPD
jgi:hypothetical protein